MAFVVLAGRESLAFGQTEPPSAAGSQPASTEAPARIKYDLLTFYKDNYFITGFTKSVEAKIQVSAKFDLWPNGTRSAVHLAFTSKLLWNIYRPSAPFAETNYNPEIFYTFFHHKDRYARPPGCGFFYERFGVEHESNGEEGKRSRAWNRIHLESRFACYTDSALFAATSLKIWLPFPSHENRDIVQYLGYGELMLNVGSEGQKNWWSEADIALLLRKGTSRVISRGSIQLDARWRPHYADFWRFTPYIYVQLFSGYGETLLTYDRSVTAFRVGLGLSDTSTRSN